jgi:dimethylhistidine N-methyltransferase
MPDGALIGSPAIVDEIVAGLTGTQKTLPAKLFYDEEGCRLFNLITTLDEYYVTRAELSVLAERAGDIVRAAPADTLVEYGASDETKADFLISRGVYNAYIPIDIAAGSLNALEGRLAANRPDLAVRPIVADFTRPIALPEPFAYSRLCGFFPGSTIGNFEPAMVVSFLSQAAETLSGMDKVAKLIVGTDLRKDPARLTAAYDDASGVTAAFNKNMLLHINRIAAGNFDIDSFRHAAVWNDRESRIEMHLVSAGRQTVEIAGETICFEDGETIHTESSYKHTHKAFLALAGAAGWHGAGFWTDRDQLFGIHLLETSLA